MTDCMSQEKMDEDNLQALKFVLTHIYNDLKTSCKSGEKYWLQPPKTILTTRRPRGRQQPENKNGKKNNSIEVLSHK